MVKRLNNSIATRPGLVFLSHYVIVGPDLPAAFVAWANVTAGGDQEVESLGTDERDKHCGGCRSAISRLRGNAAHCLTFPGEYRAKVCDISTRGLSVVSYYFWGMIPQHSAVFRAA